MIFIIFFYVYYLFLQDFCKEHMDSLGYGMYSPMDISVLPPLHLIYAENPSDSGKVCLHTAILFLMMHLDKMQQAEK